MASARRASASSRSSRRCSSRRRARRAGISAGLVRSTAADCRSNSSSLARCASAAAPVSASMRRTPEATEASLMILKADIAGAAHMGAAAQLDREGLLVAVLGAHRDNADLLAVFLAEQRERTLGDGAFRRQQPGAHFGVGTDAGVDLGLDRGDVRGAQRPGMTEIEAQPVRRDQRALLRHMLAEPPAQGLMQ